MFLLLAKTKGLFLKKQFYLNLTVFSRVNDILRGVKTNDDVSRLVELETTCSKVVLFQQCSWMIRLPEAAYFCLRSKSSCFHRWWGKPPKKRSGPGGAEVGKSVDFKERKISLVPIAIGIGAFALI